MHGITHKMPRRFGNFFPYSSIWQCSDFLGFETNRVFFFLLGHRHRSFSRSMHCDHNHTQPLPSSLFPNSNKLKSVCPVFYTSLSAVKLGNRKLIRPSNRNKPRTIFLCMNCFFFIYRRAHRFYNWMR
jgi:hypothetical protein